MRSGDVVAGTYELVRQIGAGGMGTVWEGRHLRIGRRVAIKLLRADLSLADTLSARLLREAKAAASVGSDHIVEVFDAGETAEGVTFLVMEHLDGDDLGVVLEREGPLEVERAARLGVQICRALAAAHDHGVVHRDLKPANLFLTRRSDGAEWIKVVDFGIARVRDELDTSGAEERLTVAGEVLGTPHYMAPEQAVGAAEVDHRADVYATGAVLFEMLTGRPPFTASTYNQLIVAITSGAPPRARALRPEVPEALDDLLARAMASDLDERVGSMAELREGLEAVAGERGGRREGTPETLVQAHPAARGEAMSPSEPRGGSPPPPASRGEAFYDRLSALASRHRWLPVAGVGFAATLVFAVAIGSEVCDGEPVEVPQPGCSGGRVQSEDTDGHCCWPGQLWSRSRQRCTGDVRCPPGRRRVGDECECLAGMSVGEDTGGRCCWPGQVFSESQGRCLGEPDCPRGWRRARDRCVPLVQARGDWLPISVGTFTMGSSDAEPGRRDNEAEHEVELTRDIVMMATEVTRGQFEAELGYDPSFAKRCGERCPVEMVSWHEAAAYANALSKRERLPTCYRCRGERREVRCAPASPGGDQTACAGYRLPLEAEWEYAARAGTKTATYGGDLGPGNLECEGTNVVLLKIAWFCGNSKRGPHPAATLEPNDFGMFDMLGNVWEWCHDVYRARHDPAAGAGGEGERRVIRGGSWSGHGARARAASRDGLEPTAWRSFVGFRVVKTLR